jgi:Leucine-rich repeat (LRR) protein
MGVLTSCFEKPKDTDVWLSEHPPREAEKRLSAIEELPPDAHLHPELAKVYEECQEGRGQEIKVIRLLWRDLASDDCAYLNFLLTKCPNIEELILKHNDLGAHNLIRLLPGIRCLKGLKKLSISQNKLTDEGLRTLCSLLEHHQELVEVTLDSNQLTDVQPLVTLMQKLPKLKVLWLQSNDFTNTHLLLNCSSSVVEVNLTGNPVDAGVGLKLREVFPQLILGG